MAKGRPKTATAILKLRGSKYAKGRELEPVVDGLPRMPLWLNSDEKKFWKSFVPTLIDMGIMTKIDSFRTARYCRSACEYMDESTKINRSVSKMKQLESQMEKYESSYGMTPTARAGLKVEKPKEDNPFMRFNQG